MRSLSLVRMPCFRRCSMISTTSPNHEGVEGTECEEVWMMTEESAILVMCTSLLGKMCILPQERHILCLLATNYISLRNSWASPTFNSCRCQLSHCWKRACLNEGKLLCGGEFLWTGQLLMGGLPCIRYIPHRMGPRPGCAPRRGDGRPQTWGSSL